MGDWAPQEKRSANNAGPDWEIAFYEDVLKRHPDYVEVLHQLGSLYTSSSMYAKGLKVDQRLAKLREDDPIVRYNLACSYALLKQADKAFAALAEAIELGYTDADHMDKDEDLDNVRHDPRYAEAVARMRAHKH
jgi:tetratricopeptide (TPR) repeat protein